MQVRTEPQDGGSECAVEPTDGDDEANTVDLEPPDGSASVEGAVHEEQNLTALPCRTPTSCPPGGLVESVASVLPVHCDVDSRVGSPGKGATAVVLPRPFTEPASTLRHFCAPPSPLAGTARFDGCRTLSRAELPSGDESRPCCYRQARVIKQQFQRITVVAKGEWQQRMGQSGRSPHAASSCCVRVPGSSSF
eukprot:SAG31_NODE_1601_length_7786_cov_33.553272_4_plen_193_part_00